MDTCSSRHASPPSENCSIGVPAQRKGGHIYLLPFPIGSVSQTVVTEPSPRRRLHPSHLYSIGHCAHSATQGSTSVHPVVTPHCHKIQSSWCSPSPQADETGSSPKGTHRADRSPTPPASFSRPRHKVNPPRLHGLRFSPMITDHCTGSAEALGGGFI